MGRLSSTPMRNLGKRVDPLRINKAAATRLPGVFRFPFATAGRITRGMRKVLLLSMLFAVAQAGPPRATGRDSRRARAVGCAGSGRAHLPAEVRGLPSPDPPQRRHAVCEPAGTARARRATETTPAGVIEDGKRRRHAGLEAHVAAPRRSTALLNYLVALDGAVPSAADPAHGGSAPPVAPPDEKDALLAGTVTRGVRRTAGGGHGLGEAGGAADHDVGVHGRTGRVRLSPVGERPRTRCGRRRPAGRACGARSTWRARGSGRTSCWTKRRTSPRSSRATRWWPRYPRTRRPAARMKAVFVGVCTECHAANIVLHNRFDKRGWDAVLAAMGRIGAMNTFREPPLARSSSTSAPIWRPTWPRCAGPAPSPMRFEVPARPRGRQHVAGGVRDTTCRRMRAAVC